MGNERDVKSRVISLQYNTAGLLSLLGGDDDERELFIEIWKGITTPAEFAVVEGIFDTLNRQVEGVQRSTQALQQLAQGIQDRSHCAEAS